MAVRGDITVTVDDKPISRLIKEFPDRAAKWVKTVAFRAEAIAKQKAPVDTGFLRNSIRAVVWGGEGSGGLAGATGPRNRFEAIIAVTAWYAIYVEFGTALKAARPFLAPAVREAIEEGRRAVRELFKV